MNDRLETVLFGRFAKPEQCDSKTLEGDPEIRCGSVAEFVIMWESTKHHSCFSCLGPSLEIVTRVGPVIVMRAGRHVGD